MLQTDDGAGFFTGCLLACLPGSAMNYFCGDDAQGLSSAYNYVANDDCILGTGWFPHCVCLALKVKLNFVNFQGLHPALQLARQLLKGPSLLGWAFFILAKLSVCHPCASVLPLVLRFAPSPADRNVHTWPMRQVMVCQ